MSSRYNFPSWNYGYTLAPSGAQYYQPPPQFGPVPPPPPPPPLPPPRFASRGPLGVRPPPPYVNFRGRSAPGAGRGSVRPSVSLTAGEGEAVAPDAAGPDGSQLADDASSPEQKDSGAGALEGANGSSTGQEDANVCSNERPLSEILRGRNAIMWCNDQSKVRGLRMEWEQVSETGPPHNKTFTWSLKMGEMSTVGSALSKKGAKNKAAEEMAKKLDKLPRPHKRTFHHFYHPGLMCYGQFHPPPPPWMHMQPMKRRKMMPSTKFNAAENGVDACGNNPVSAAAVEEGELPAEAPVAAAAHCQSVPVSSGPVPPVPPAPVPQPQSNPISKLYEYCKHRKLNEPIFEVIQETVLEKKRTSKGFTLKRTEFTMQCDILGKKFVGVAMTKKQAKYNAAAAAWDEINNPAETAPSPSSTLRASAASSSMTMTTSTMKSEDQIDHLLQKCRSAATAITLPVPSSSSTAPTTSAPASSAPC